MKLIRLSFILSLFILFSSCSKNENIPSGIEVQTFIWKGLNAYYLWQGDVPDLSDRRFSSDQQLYSYLGAYPNPSNLFQSLLNQPGIVDRFSWIVDDYTVLENAFQGVTLSNGMVFGLVKYRDNSGNVFGFVKYVVPNSDAANKGIIRGNIFNTINGTQITESNFRNLLRQDSYTIGLSDFNNGNPTSNDTTALLTKSQITENPIAVTNVIEDGSNKIGYILYNQFSSNFDSQLNTAFADFKNQNITDLIVDLRYNGGGSVRTATYLASMIHGTSNGQIFATQTWNQKVQNALDIDFNNYFVNTISATGESINTLNLPRVYFIVSDRTASASELVINGLKPYIDVNVIGKKTVGKTVGSITLYDSDNYAKDGANLNPNHTWALQPIVLSIVNKDGTSDPNGIIPNIPLPENFGNLGVLGERTDPLLDRTITYILTGARPSARNSFFNLKQIGDSKMNLPNYNNMYVNDIK